MCGLSPRVMLPAMPDQDDIFLWLNRAPDFSCYCELAALQSESHILLVPRNLYCARLLSFRILSSNFIRQCSFQTSYLYSRRVRCRMRCLWTVKKGASPIYSPVKITRLTSDPGPLRRRQPVTMTMCFEHCWDIARPPRPFAVPT